jgi:Lanthionine synthetase C-like protein
LPLRRRLLPLPPLPPPLLRHHRCCATSAFAAAAAAAAGLCHGASGNAYALLSLYRVTRDAKYLRRAHRFAEFMGSSDFAQVPTFPPASSILVCLPSTWKSKFVARGHSS